MIRSYDECPISARFHQTLNAASGTVSKLGLRYTKVRYGVSVAPCFSCSTLVRHQMSR